MLKMICHGSAKKLSWTNMLVNIVHGCSEKLAGCKARWLKMFPERLVNIRTTIFSPIRNNIRFEL